ncbi:MAG: hypothetical protein HY801_08095 [Candidatus Lindowbacteria bacterium]|nr:hypothetical protein [Candidatus Lindowbacteria bacterium]
MVKRNAVDASKFNVNAILPYELRLQDFQMAMQDVYDFFYDVNAHLSRKGLQRLDDMLRPAIMSGVLSDMLTASLAKHSRALTENKYFNGHPDLVVRGIYAENAIKAGTEGIEMTFVEAYLGRVTVEDFRKNPRGELGTRTATLHKEGIKKLRENWLYRL